MLWEPSGAVICLDLNLPLDQFLEMLRDIGLEDGLENFQGFHYSLNGSSECIVTMEDKFESFRSRLNSLGKGVAISIRPLNPFVSIH